MPPDPPASSAIPLHFQPGEKQLDALADFLIQQVAARRRRQPPDLLPPVMPSTTITTAQQQANHGPQSNEQDRQEKD
jgi:hypothetical protein